MCSAEETPAFAPHILPLSSLALVKQHCQWNRSLCELVAKPHKEPASGKTDSQLVNFQWKSGVRFLRNAWARVLTAGLSEQKMRKSCKQDKNMIVGNTQEMRLMCPGLERKMQRRRDWVAGREGERKWGSMFWCYPLGIGFLSAV